MTRRDTDLGWLIHRALFRTIVSTGLFWSSLVIYAAR